MPSSLARNPVSVAGAWLTTLSACGFIAYYVADSLGLFASPYAGLLGFVLVPAVFLLGLALIPLGIWREHRRRRRGQAPWAWPAIDLGRPRTRRVWMAVLALTLVNLAIVGVAGLGAVHYMESDQFCGQVCHEPMHPEFTAHQQAPHASVRCVQCHVGTGAAGMLRAKMNGTRQLYLVVAHSFARPIPTPARGLPVAAETCARCHSAGYPQRDVTVVKREYADDQTSTESVTSLVMHTAAIHWHARPDVQVEYIAPDPQRQTIPYVKVTATDGRVTEYFADGVTSAPAGGSRRMDCLDCHSRPAHTFAASPERVVDHAIASGEVSRQLPFVRREMVAALKGDYRNQPPVEGLRARLTAVYQAQPSAAAELGRVVDATARAYQMNVFPIMKVTWGTYQSNLGHSDLPGCMRCHDGSHTARDGRVIKQDCDLCHTLQ